MIYFWVAVSQIMVLLCVLNAYQEGKKNSTVVGNLESITESQKRIIKLKDEAINSQDETIKLKDESIGHLESAIESLQAQVKIYSGK